MQMTEAWQIAIWFCTCVFVFLFSIFLHEVGHGFAFKIRGYSVSTGFNRVGNVHKFPKELGFRPIEAQSFLLDFGVPITLMLTVVFTLMLMLMKPTNEYVAKFFSAVALCNAFLRIVPCLLAFLIPIFTKKAHIEDEVGTGLLLVERYGKNWLKMLPILFSLIVSIVCYSIVMIRMHNLLPAMKILTNLSVWSAFVIAFITANYLDGIFRINWIAKETVGKKH